MFEHFSTPTIVAVFIIAILHSLFLILEMFFWAKPLGQKIFGLTPEFAQQSAKLAANQGLYNGFLATGLLWGLLGTGGFDALVFFLSCIIIAGVYGAATVSRAIFFIQSIPAMLTFLFLISFH